MHFFTHSLSEAHSSVVKLVVRNVKTSNSLKAGSRKQHSFICLDVEPGEGGDVHPR